MAKKMPSPRAIWQSLPTTKRALAVYTHDVGMAAVSFVLSLVLRLGVDAFSASSTLLTTGTAMFTLCAVVVFGLSGLYRGIWRYASLNDLFAITRAVTTVIVVFFALMFLLVRLEDVPRSLPFINWFVLMALLGGPRILYRWAKDRRFNLKLINSDRPRVPVLLVGADDTAELFIRALARDPAPNYRVVGIIAVKPGRVGRQIQGFQVIDVVGNMETVIEQLAGTGDRPQRLVLTNEGLDGAEVSDLLERADRLGLSLSRLPRMTDFKSGEADRMEVRPIAIEDLLGRPQARLDADAMAQLVKGRRVMITGAGGSIGAELVRQVAALAPANLALLDNTEFNLYAIDMEMAQSHPNLLRTAILADVRDANLINRLFAQHQPQIVFHAAALKHVPLVEENPIEGLMTNVIGTCNVADACVAHNVRALVQISTDKAVNPTNVMGASKRIAEMYCQAFDVKEGARAKTGVDATRFVTVRFGNVLGSTGSVVPLFTKQLKAGGPLTVTHPDMTRYFMTIREAVELVLQAAAAGSEQEGRTGHDQDGKIFVLDMGEPVKIVDLARQMIRLAGYVPDEDITIKFTGLRPGEKLFEEIFHGAEPPMPTGHEGLLLAAPRANDFGDMVRAVAEIAALCAKGDQIAALAFIGQLVPEYQPE